MHHINRFYLKTIFTISFFVIFGFGNFALAQFSTGIEINPHVIDEKVNANDLLKYNISLKNNTEFKANLYVMVNDLTEDGGMEEYISPSKLDRETSLARWIKIKRGVIELMPGDSVEVPLEIEVYLKAIPGKRYAVISFPEGTNRLLAEKRMANEPVPEILINFEVVENIIERAQIKKFMPVKRVFFKYPIDFNLDIENFGNREIVPAGSVYIYNRRAIEVGEIKINENNEKIPPDGSLDLPLAWSKSQGFGKFKAKLELEYGQSEIRDMQDTVYFWVLPLSYLVIFLIGLLVVIGLLTILIFRKTFHFERDESRASEAEVEGVINLREQK